MKTSLYSGIALATVMTAGLATPALAQTAPGDWSGYYLGVFGAANEVNEGQNESLQFDRDFDGEFDDSVVLSGSGTNAFGPGFCAGTALGSTASQRCDIDHGGTEFGVRAGYDWQSGNWVYGLVAEYSVGDIKDSVTGFSTTPASYTMIRDLEKAGAVRARMGYAAGPLLVYGTGGVAFATIENRFQTTNGANSFSEQVNDRSADGYQYGAGVEYKLAPNLRLVGEYVYTSLDAGDYVVRAGPGTAGPTNPFILPPNTAGTDIIRSSDEFDYHSFRIGVNVRF